MKRLIGSLLVTGTLFAVGVPVASAHGSMQGRQSIHYSYYVARHHHGYPGWLHGHSDFRHWYSRSRFRKDFYLSWDQLFEIYCYERKYRRPFRDQHDHGRHPGYRRHH